MGVGTKKLKVLAHILIFYIKKTSNSTITVMYFCCDAFISNLELINNILSSHLQVVIGEHVCTTAIYII